ncbi:MAG: MBL fold metallo-hydrolase [Candidatus Marinimicrobia bacterium]|nr:MBL fold metallo-hydrolase [Candidatus Neomarinimicrobiota bacterium]
MGNVSKRLYLIFLLLITLLIACTNSKNEVKIHYLGHSAFFLDFNKKVTVLCDYGKENAYLEWGWDSPIYDAGEPGPDIITYSHFHDDHFDKERASHYEAVRISGKVDTCIRKLKIIDFFSSEKDISRFDNHSYLFTYNDFQILHLGDCQADIMMLNDPAHAWNLEQRYPKHCDILIIPIEGTRQYIPQAVKMVQLLEPKVLLPTHFWSEKYKKEFIDEMMRIYKQNKKKLQVISSDGPEYTYIKQDNKSGLLLLDLKPSARNK